MTDQQNDGALPAGSGSRMFLPVPGLGVAGVWRVGPVLFHPAGAARELIDAMPREGELSNNRAFHTWLDDRVSTLSESAVAEVGVPDADDAKTPVDVREQVANALTVIRVVQRMRNPMASARHQAFGLPGEVPSAVLDYVIIGHGTTAGAARWGALAGWTFTDADHEAWMTDPAFRFLDQALIRPEPDRNVLQSRALLAASLLSEGWLSYKPDIELLNSAMALEILLGEATDKDKKFRIARRTSYFACGWPRQLYPGTGRRACRLLSAPLNSQPPGVPGPELRRVLDDMRAGRTIQCTKFFDVCDIYAARNEIVHQGRLAVGRKRPDTWFIATYLLASVLAWFARHPDSDLSELDAEIAALPTD